MIRHHLDALTIKEIVLDQEYLPSVKYPKVIIDIGANIGTFSTLMSLQHPKAKIYAFEPDPRTFKLLTTNLTINQCQNVISERKGLSHQSGHARFYSSNISGLSGLNRSTNQGKINTTRIRTINLSEILSKNKINQVDFLKIDAEGAEFDILLNSPNRIFYKIKEIVLEYHNHLTVHHHNEIIKKLQQHGYQIVTRPHPFEKDIGIIQAKK